jgi:preprotein translocase subunit SecG
MNEPNRRERGRVPRWVVLLVVVLVIAAALAVVVILMANDGHQPMDHGLGGTDASVAAAAREDAAA